VLSHLDNIQASGFLEHIKLPHYVDFQAELSLVRKMRAEISARNAEQETARDVEQETARDAARETARDAARETARDAQREPALDAEQEATQ
jgi:alpha-D-ribose 1-methylphosphonate 5-triphosphate synthase subunit PhnI